MVRWVSGADMLSRSSKLGKFEQNEMASRTSCVKNSSQVDKDKQIEQND